METPKGPDLIEVDDPNGKGRKKLTKLWSGLLETTKFTWWIFIGISKEIFFNVSDIISDNYLDILNYSK